MAHSTHAPRFVRWFRELSLGDVPLVGGKNASLGELFRTAAELAVPVPDGFAITAEAYRYLLDASNSWERLHEALDGLDPSDVDDLSRRGRQARDVVLRAPIPPDLEAEIVAAYRQLIERVGAGVGVAVRSSATAEDLPSASFAGQQDSFLGIHGEAALLDAFRRSLASLFTDRAIHYRVDQGFDHFQVAVSVGVQQIVRSDLAESGVAFTLDTESGFRDVVFVTSAYGLGENLVQGLVDPDEFYVHKPTFREGYRGVLRRRLGEKAVRRVFAEGQTREATRNVATLRSERDRYSITDDEVLTIADYAIRIEDHYSRQCGEHRPMDIEWAKDGGDERIYIVQARPETVASRRSPHVLEEYELVGSGPVRVRGRAVGAKIGAGPARCVTSSAQMAAFRPGEVLVAETTAPDWEPLMKKASAIVTDRGGRTCHAAIVARELGIPAIVGAEGATSTIRDGDEITVSCAEGETGTVYEGRVDYRITEVDLRSVPRPATQIMVNLGNPELAFATSRLPCDGVGLARLEFIISESIGAHPMALAHPDRVTDETTRAEIAHLARHHETPAEFFVDQLAQGVGTIAAAFFPRPVIVRLSDFKTNEYADLLGGRDFEPTESNPMLGFRGASRYAHPAYADGFALECAAIRRVRNELGLRNVRIMIPFCRRVDEGRRVIEALSANGLRRGEHGLEIYVMCEIPNNVVQIDAFAELFDGFSIGSNDLTQLALGVDRDSELVAFDFDERDPGVLDLIRLAIEGARRNGRYSGICGQAPSDYVEVAEFLVEHGIDSISLTPDSVLSTMRRIAEVEASLGIPPREPAGSRVACGPESEPRPAAGRTPA